MVWTKLKKVVEAHMADSLQGRIQYHLARYGKGVSYFMSRGWITFDKDEIANFSTIKRVRASYTLTGEWYSHDNQVLTYLDKEGIFTRDDFVNALEEYVELQVEDAIRSSNPIIRAVAMFDRRLGKRRLSVLSMTEDEHQLVKTFYKIRCQAEGFVYKPDTA